MVKDGDDRRSFRLDDLFESGEEETGDYYDDADDQVFLQALERANMTWTQKRKSQSSEPVEVPEQFICPLTLQIMINPLQHQPGGYSFEKSAIEAYIKAGNDRCPLTLMPLDMEDFVLNESLKQEIQVWREEYQIIEDESEDSQEVTETSEEEDVDDEEDDEETLQAIANAERIFQHAATADRRSSYQKLIDFGNRILQQRDNKKLDQHYQKRSPRLQHSKTQSLVGYFQFDQ